MIFCGFCISGKTKPCCSLRDNDPDLFDRIKKLPKKARSGRKVVNNDTLVENNNISEVFTLKENSDFSTTLHQILVKQYDKDHKSLNEPQLNLFLCMHLENSGQSCGILGCLQEWYPQYKEKFVLALKEIGATKSAEAIKKAINLLPKDGSWFFESSNEATEELMSRLDSEFSDYPDGSMPDLYRKYAELNRNHIEEGIENYLK